MSRLFPVYVHPLIDAIFLSSHKAGSHPTKANLTKVRDVGAAMQVKIELIILESIAGIFGWVWIGASIGAIYFLYQASANDGPWIFVLWSIVAGLVAKTIAVVVNDNQQRLPYVDQLMERGYPRSEAGAAWRTAANGGFNLLLSLQQIETCYEI